MNEEYAGTHPAWRSLVFRTRLLLSPRFLDEGGVSATGGEGRPNFSASHR